MHVADYFKHGNADITEFVVIMEDTRNYCSLYLTNTIVEFTRRQANEVAHELTQTALSEPSFRISDNVPTCIELLIATEMV